MPPKSRTISIHGLDIAYWDEGHGLPLVFIHGNSLSKRVFTRQFDNQLAERYRLLAIDLPGHGESSNLPTGKSYTVELYTSVIADCWEGLQCRGGILIGYSLGGHLCLQSAAATRGLGGVVIFGTPPLGRPPRMEEAFLPNPAFALGFQEEVSQAELELRDQACFSPATCPAPPFFQEDFRRADPRLRTDLARCVEDLAYGDETEILQALSCPLAILHGEADALCNGRYLEGLAIPTLWRGRVQTLVGASHTPQWEQPRLFNRLVDEFARSITGE